MKVKTFFGYAVMAVVCLSGVQAKAADQLTIQVQVNATALDPSLTGVSVACQAFFDAAYTSKFAEWPIQSQILPRQANGSASGSVSIVFNNWNPNAKYYWCGLRNHYPTSWSAFYFDSTAPSYVEMSRRAKSGTLEVKGIVP